jgi:nicotinate-nucleotide pyrophosphorylase (carboxylating)
MTDLVLPPALPRLMVEPIVRAALLEDLGRAGDLTTDSIVPADARFSGAIVSRQAGTVAGTDAAALAFALLNPAVAVSVLRPDGSRVALNLLCRLSGVATATASLVEAARPHGKARIVCTRKTTPGLRSLEKHAVRAGGGANHRFGLDDAVLIKDNHVAVAGGVAPAVRRARAGVGHLVKIEVEVDTLAQLEEALSVGADAVLLDNMSPDTLRAAVAMIDGRAVSEASGRISRETVGAVAATGVDLISTGWITHSAPIVDLGLDVA